MFVFHAGESKGSVTVTVICGLLLFFRRAFLCIFVWHFVNAICLPRQISTSLKALHSIGQNTSTWFLATAYQPVWEANRFPGESPLTRGGDNARTDQFTNPLSLSCHLLTTLQPTGLWSSMPVCDPPCLASRVLHHRVSPRCQRIYPAFDWHACALKVSQYCTDADGNDDRAAKWWL